MYRIDLHCDTMTMLRKKETLAQSHCSVTLENLKQSETLLQCFAAFIPTGYFPPFLRKDLTCRLFADIHKKYTETLKTYRNDLYPVRKYEDLERCRKERKTGALLTLEDGGILGENPEDIEKFYRKGVRLITLTWNTENPIGYPRSSDAEKMQRGLKPYGFVVLEEMERLGIAVDVSHLSDGGFRDVMAHSKKPVLASHSNARSVQNHPRNLTDEMIRSISEKGGIIGLNFGPEFLSDRKGNHVTDIVHHIRHIYQVGGEDVLAFGSDFDGVKGCEEVKNPCDCEKIYEALKKEAGFSDAVLEKLWWKNADRYFYSVL